MATELSVEASHWRCCHCEQLNVYAAFPKASLCPKCFEHFNTGCCNAYTRGSSDNDGSTSPLPHREIEADEGVVLSDLETEGAMERIDLKLGMTEQQNALSSKRLLSASPIQRSLDTEQPLKRPLKRSFARITKRQLKQSLEQPVEQPVELPSGDESVQVTDSIQSPLQTWSRRLISRALEPRLQPDKIRIRYRCCCGTHVWDDYPMKLAEQALELEAQLRKLAQQAETNPASARNAAGSPAKSSILADLKSVFNGLKRRLLRQEAPQRADNESQQCSQSTPASESDSSAYYLTCFPESNDRRPVLSQIAGTNITGDHAYFSMLRVEARKHQRLWSRFLIPRKIKAIRYVQLHLLHDNRHANVKEGAMPEFPVDRAVYSPVKTDFEIAKPMHMGSRILLHYFEKTHDCCQYPHILQSIPKKLKGKLLIIGEDGPAVGWGMLLEDGIDTLRIGIAGIAGLLVSTAIGITYAKLLGDVQGGSGITQCLMYFVTFIVALHGIGEVR